MLIVYIKNCEEWICILILRKWNPQITCIIKKIIIIIVKIKLLIIKLQVLQYISLKQWKCYDTYYQNAQFYMFFKLVKSVWFYWFYQVWTKLTDLLVFEFQSDFTC